MWSEWVDGACSKTCDYGVRTRYRSCIGPYCGGRECRGVKEVVVDCNERPCQGMHPNKPTTHNLQCSLCVINWLSWSHTIDHDQSYRFVTHFALTPLACTVHWPDCMQLSLKPHTYTHHSWLLYLRISLYVGCLVPVPPEGVLFHVGGNATEIKHDQELSYTCGRGFDSKFDNISQSFPSIQCVGGVWEGDRPSCEGRHKLFKLYIMRLCTMDRSTVIV